MDNQAILSIRDLRVVFEDGFTALGGVSIDIGENEFVTLLGPSGCGKTTLLRCIGGFEKPTSGEILYKGKNIIGLPPYKRAINTVFQRYALFPHLNVAQNVAFGPDLRKEDKKKTAEEVSRMLAAVFSTLLGTVGAIALYQMKRGPRKALLSIVNLPMLNSEVVTGVSLMLLYAMVNIQLGYLTLLLSHIAFCVPYVVLSVMPKLRQLDPNLAEAAQDLGATPMQGFFKVILPDIMPGVFSGFIMALTMSIDDFVVSFFTTGSGVSNLSITIYTMAKRGISPKINALSTIIFACVFVLLIGLNLRDFRKDGRSQKKLDEVKIPY